jgi:hypothetical protein
MVREGVKQVLSEDDNKKYKDRCRAGRGLEREKRRRRLAR